MPRMSAARNPKAITVATTLSLYTRSIGSLLSPVDALSRLRQNFRGPSKDWLTNSLLRRATMLHRKKCGKA